jgi:hypothetical protein
VLFLPRKPGCQSAVVCIPQRGRALALDSGESEFCEFDSALDIFGTVFAIDRQLFARVTFILGVSNHFLPDCGGALVFAAPLGHQC